MATKKIVRTIRVDPVLDNRITSYARAAGVCSQINVDTFGGRFSTLHAKTCRPSPIKPNLIVATSSIQKGRKDNDQHVRRKFYTAAEA